MGLSGTEPPCLSGIKMTEEWQQRRGRSQDSRGSVVNGREAGSGVRSKDVCCYRQGHGTFRDIAVVDSLLQRGQHRPFAASLAACLRQ